MNPRHYALIVAAGSGVRMQSETPKQYLALLGQPVLYYCIQTFLESIPAHQITIVINAAHTQWWEKIQEQHLAFTEIKTIAGGNTRFQSVKNGLQTIQDEYGIVSIHDGARPLLSSTLVQKMYTAAEKMGAAIPVIPLVDSIRQKQNAHSVAVDRSAYCAVQTPQSFQLELLKKAYEQDYQRQFTDDASVVEGLGHSIHLVEGEAQNIKLTRPMDVKIAESLLKSQ